MKPITMPCDNCDAETVVCFSQDDAELRIVVEKDWRVFFIDDGPFPRLAFRCLECQRKTEVP